MAVWNGSLARSLGALSLGALSLISLNACDSGNESEPLGPLTCADGSAVEGARCNGVSECSDGSDELDCELAGFTAARATTGDVFAGYPVVFEIGGVPSSSIEVTLDGRIIAPVERYGSSLTVLTPGDAPNGPLSFELRSAQAAGAQQISVGVVARPGLNEMLAQTSYTSSAQLLAGSVAELPVILAGSVAQLETAQILSGSPLLLSGATTLSANIDTAASLLSGSSTSAQERAATALLTVQATLLSGTVRARMAAAGAVPAQASAEEAALIVDQASIVAALAIIRGLKGGLLRAEETQTLTEAERQQIEDFVLGYATFEVLAQVADYVARLDTYLTSYASTSLQIVDAAGDVPETLSVVIGGSLNLRALRRYEGAPAPLITATELVEGAIERTRASLADVFNGVAALALDAGAPSYTRLVDDVESTLIASLDESALLVSPILSIEAGTEDGDFAITFGWPEEPFTAAAATALTFAIGADEATFALTIGLTTCSVYSDCAAGEICAIDVCAAAPECDPHNLGAPHPDCAVDELCNAEGACVDGDTCGNDVLDVGELCDTGDGANSEDACPVSCTPSVDVCMETTLEAAGTCLAECVETPKAPSGLVNDACCPLDGTSATDQDCADICGDDAATVDPNENCDIAIVDLEDPGYCPTECAVDDNVCTDDGLVGELCQALCVSEDIRTLVGGDGCCPVGADNDTDSDCTPLDEDCASAPCLTITSVATGGNHACAITSGGAVYCWGENQHQQVGLTPLNPAPPTSTSFGNGFPTELALGENHSCLLRTGGLVYCWGRSDLGQIGDDATTNPAGSVQDDDGLIDDAIAIAAAKNTTCVVRQNRTVSCWGSNANGELGIDLSPGELIQANRIGSEVLVDGGASLGDVVSITAGDNHFCALQSDGTPYCWGNNGSGQHCVSGGGFAAVATPFDDAALRLNSMDAGGDTTCGLDADGELSCCGLALETATITPSTTSAMTTVSNDNVYVSLDIGFNVGCVVDELDVVRCWGENGRSQLGDAMTLTSASPVAHVGLLSPRDISVSEDFGCAVDTSGAVRCWGDNDAGQLGLGVADTDLRLGATVPLGVGGCDIGLGGSFGCARLPDATVECWGYNAQGQIGVDPALEAGGRTTPSLLAVSDAAALDVGRSHSCYSDANYNVYCWGENAEGQFGNGDTVSSHVPTATFGAAELGASAGGTASTCAVSVEGVVNCWGRILDGSTGGQSSAIPQVVNFSGGTGPSGLARLGTLSMQRGTACVIHVSGEASCWGEGSDGQLGRNSMVDGATPDFVLDPVEVMPLQNVLDISVGDKQACAIAAVPGELNKLYCWGDDTFDQLGLGAGNTSTARAVEVTGLIGEPVQLVSGTTHTCVLNTLGGVQCFGTKTNDGLGTGNDREPSPAQVTGLDGTGLRAMRLFAGEGHTCATLEDGSVRCWGSNVFGALGDSTTNNRTSPTCMNL